MLGYEFLKLDAEQKAARRYLLNLYGTIGQWSILAVLVFVQLAVLVRWAVFRTSSVERPRSPHPNKAMALGKRAWFGRVDQRLTRFRWWADEPLRQGWFTKGECILGFVWTVWLLFLSVHRTGNDYLHLTKRFGMVAASQLPLQYILAMRSAYSPIQILTRLSYERVIAIHELLGKILTLFFGLHGVLYLNYFIQSGVLSNRIRELDVITGIIGFIMFATMSTTALSFIRNWNYRVFYTTHILLAIILVDVLILHVSHIRTYAFEMLAAFVLLQIFRQAKTRQFSGTIAVIPGTSLIQITIPLPFANDAKAFKPGQHVHLSRPPLGHPSSLSYVHTFAQRYRTNPFTIASLPPTDNRLILIARPLAGNTAHLAAVAHALRTDSTPTSIPLTLEGPYGSPPDLSATLFDNILLIAGGIGATFTAPLFRTVVDRNPATRVRFVWAVRRLAETRWAFPPASSPPGTGGAAVDIFVTRGDDDGALLARDQDVELAEASTLVGDGEGSGEEDEDEEWSGEEEEGEKASLVADGRRRRRQQHPRRTITRGERPDLARIVDEAFDGAGEGGPVAVVVCGPEGMVRDVRKRVGRWVGEGREVFWHAEAFGL